LLTKLDLIQSLNFDRPNPNVSIGFDS